MKTLINYGLFKLCLPLYIYIYTHIYIHIYIYRERERETEQEEGREYVCVFCVKYAYRVDPGYNDIGL
jgi:hypothetical protein